jgi:hypothetical protein
MWPGGTTAMRSRRKLVLGLIALAIAVALVLSGRASRAKRQLERTKRALREHGFKVDLNQFDLSTPPEIKKRASILGTTTRAALTNRDERFASWRNLRTLPTSFRPVEKDAALIIWKQALPRSYERQDLWPELRESLASNRAGLDAAIQAALGGPIRFEPIGPGPDALLPYLADLKQLEGVFQARTMLALHDGMPDVAWTNLLAATSLVTEYAPEPIDISHLVRAACGGIAFELTWNTLQARHWTDTQLADLQRRWQSIEFWRGLPETAAFARANNAAIFELERNETLEPGLSFKEAFQSPKQAWARLGAWWTQVRYRHKGSYEDEERLLLYYRDRELELKRAVRATTWSEMRQLPGVTNATPFVSTNGSRATARLNLRQMGVLFQARGGGLPGRIAEAETRRRILVTAVAIERYRGLHGVYPPSLDKLVPELLPDVPTDFMDGQALRYRLSGGGCFVLYSVGLDCVDDGGTMRGARQQQLTRGSVLQQALADPESLGFGAGKGTDIVWPRAASEAEAQHLEEEERKAERDRLAMISEEQAARQWTRTAHRMARNNSLDESVLAGTTIEPLYLGQPLGEALRTKLTIADTNKLSLAEMLTLRPIHTGSEPETLTFELPIKYDALTNIGELKLQIDPIKDRDFYEDWDAEMFVCSRATNGNCLLVWSTIFEAPGKHALRTALVWQAPSETSRTGPYYGKQNMTVGPVAWFDVTNLCQFSLSSAHFYPEHGVMLRARLVESNVVYTAEIEAPSGDVLKTLEGTNSDGVLELFWDLKDERGTLCTNTEYRTVFHITLPDSGRAQTIRGP